MMQVGQTICHVLTCTRGCTTETGCQGHAWRERAAAYYLKAVEDLLADAAVDGIIITVEQRPLQPLAMGNHETVVSTRPVLYRAKST